MLKRPHKIFLSPAVIDRKDQIMLRHFSVIVFAALVSSSGLMAETPTVSMPAGHRALLESHCTKCHNADKQKGLMPVGGIVSYIYINISMNCISESCH